MTVADAREEWLNLQRPWRPEYVPYAERPSYAKLKQSHAVAAGHYAFYVDPETGVDGVFVLSVGPTTARVQFNVARREQLELRSGERDVYLVRTCDLRDTWELAGLAARGRVMLIRLGLADVWPGPVREERLT